MRQIRSAVRFVLFVLALFGALLVAGPLRAVDQTVNALITCPETIKYEVDWPDKIGHDPTFKSGSIDRNRTAKLSTIGRSSAAQGQRLMCVYTDGKVSKEYHYDVERKIVKCTSQPPNKLLCELKK